MRIVRYNYPSYRSLASSNSAYAGAGDELDRLFTSAFGGCGDFQGRSNRVPVDLYEDKDNTYVRAELPGVDRADIGVELAEGSLNIRATRKAREGESGGGESVTLSRAVSVAEASVQADKISAAYENGVLTVTLPKREEAKPRTVTVAVN